LPIWNIESGRERRLIHVPVMGILFKIPQEIKQNFYMTYRKVNPVPEVLTSNILTVMMNFYIFIGTPFSSED
jgi:hypothetical protein